MPKLEPTLVPVLIAALIASGCQSAHPVTITEYRPAHPPAVQRAPASEVFELVRWQPVATAATQPASPVPQIPVEVERRYLDRGQTLGFEKKDGQLLAISGDTAMPLVEAHYEWKTVASHQPNKKLDQCINGAGEAAVVVFVVAAVGGLIFLAFHEARHCWNISFDP
jgi:hypothetical protein